MRATHLLPSCVLALILVSVWGRAFALETPAPTAIGPEGGWITALAVSPSFDSDGKLWAAAFGGRIFASGDAASTWSESHAGETDPVVENLAASPNFASDRTVFAASDEGVFKTVDGGRNWTSSSAGLGHHFCRAIALSATYGSGGAAFVATDAGVYHSTDGGTSWDPPTTGTLPVISLAAVSSGTAGGAMYAGLDAGGLEQSLDGGEHWQPVSQFPSARRVLAILPVAGSTSSSLLVATDNGLWRSRDTGSTWLQVGAEGDRVDALTLGGSNSSAPVLYAGSAGGHGVYASSDQGATWRRTGAPSVPFVTTLAAAGASTLIAGTTGGGIALSVDGGLNWKSSNYRLFASQTASLHTVGGRLLMSGNGGARMKSTATDEWNSLGVPNDFVTSADGRGDTLFAGTQDAGLMISRDAGSTWFHSSLPDGAVSDVAVSPPAANYTVLVADAYVYRSIDGGASFSRSATIAGNDVRSFSFSPDFEHDKTVFAGTLNHGVYRSEDGGVTWVGASSGLPSSPVTAVITSPVFPVDHTLYAATAGNGVFHSTDNGATWFPVVPAVPDSVVDALAWTQSGQLLAGTEHGVLLLESSSWSLLGGGWDGYVSALQGTVENGTEYLYAGTTGQGVWKMMLGTAPPTAVPMSPTVPSATYTPTPQLPTIRVPTPTPVATAQPGARPPTLRLRADPVPAVAHRPALLSAKGPAGGRVQVALDAPGWQRRFSATLPKDGTIGFGFISPASQITVVGVVTLHGRTGSARLVIPIRHS